MRVYVTADGNPNLDTLSAKIVSFDRAPQISLHFNFNAWAFLSRDEAKQIIALLTPLTEDPIWNASSTPQPQSSFSQSAPYSAVSV